MLSGRCVSRGRRWGWRHLTRLDESVDRVLGGVAGGRLGLEDPQPVTVGVAELPGVLLVVRRGARQVTHVPSARSRRDARVL